MTLIYSPSDDTYLMLNTLLKNLKDKKLKILEVGTGSGFILKELKEKGFCNLTGLDINRKAVQICNKNGLDVFESDLFSNISEKFDVIYFNPPYLPNDDDEDDESRLSTTGGATGSEIINRFLTDAKDYLTVNGQIYLLTSSLTREIKWNGWTKKKVSEGKLFFETLYVWELTI